MKSGCFLLSLLLSASLLAGASGMVYASGAADFLLQDELFFLQEEFKKAQVQIVEKDSQIKALVIEKDQALAREQGFSQEKLHLQRKVEDLQKALVLQRQESEQACSRNDALWQRKLVDYTRKAQVQSLILEQKDSRFETVSRENGQLQLELRKSREEKDALRKNLARLTEESRGTSSHCDQRLAKEREGCNKKVADLQARLNAEQTLVNEKVRAAVKPLEDRLAGLTQELKQANQKFSASQQKAASDPRPPRIRDIEESARKKVAEAQGVMRLAVKSSIRAERKSAALKKQYESIVAALKNETAERLRACEGAALK